MFPSRHIHRNSMLEESTILGEVAKSFVNILNLSSPGKYDVKDCTMIIKSILGEVEGHQSTNFFKRLKWFDIQAILRYYFKNQPVLRIKICGKSTRNDKATLQKNLRRLLDYLMSKSSDDISVSSNAAESTTFVEKTNKVSDHPVLSSNHESYNNDDDDDSMNDDEEEWPTDCMDRNANSMSSLIAFGSKGNFLH